MTTQRPVAERLRALATEAGLAPESIETMTAVEFCLCVSDARAAHDAARLREGLASLESALRECQAGAAMIDCARPMASDCKDELCSALFELTAATTALRKLAAI
jgi:alkanesulfonate monooxygenase SsuD/methylene tetrahydromethanopterin reductase-like flavin-dependent oxidoreductase (luciferase family)